MWGGNGENSVFSKMNKRALPEAVTSEQSLNMLLHSLTSSSLLQIVIHLITKPINPPFPQPVIALVPSSLSFIHSFTPSFTQQCLRPWALFQPQTCLMPPLFWTCLCSLGCDFCLSPPAVLGLELPPPGSISNLPSRLRDLAPVSISHSIAPAVNFLAWHPHKTMSSLNLGIVSYSYSWHPHLAHDQYLVNTSKDNQWSRTVSTENKKENHWPTWDTIHKEGEESICVELIYAPMGHTDLSKLHTDHMKQAFLTSIHRWGHGSSKSSNACQRSHEQYMVQLEFTPKSIWHSKLCSCHITGLSPSRQVKSIWSLWEWAQSSGATFMGSWTPP